MTHSDGKRIPDFTVLFAENGNAERFASMRPWSDRERSLYLIPDEDKAEGNSTCFKFDHGLRDAPRYDQDWLDTLFAAADREQKFRVLDFQVLTRDFSADQHRHLAYLLRKDAPPHRAAEDASRLASKLMETHWGHPPRKSHLPAFSDFGGESR